MLLSPSVTPPATTRPSCLLKMELSQVYGLDGNAYYARPGPRLLQGSGIIARLLNGDTVGDEIGEEISPRDSWTAVADPRQRQGSSADDATTLST